MAAQTASEPHAHAQLTTAQRIERFVVIVVLIGLIATGLPQRYPTEGWANVAFVLSGGVESMRILHRFFALLLLGEAIYHVLALLYRLVVLKAGPALLPRFSDVGAFVGRLAANFGLRKGAAPAYTFVLRFEYLVIVIGVIVLGITGLILWNPVAATQSLPGEAIPVANSVHSDHALLTVIVLVLLRLGVVLLWRPKRAEAIAERIPAAIDPGMAARRRVFVPVAAVVGLIALVGVFALVTSEQTAITTVPRQRAVIYAPQAIPDSGDPEVGAALWATLRCAFCHGENAEGGARGEPSLRTGDLTYTAFYEQVRIGWGDMPSFSTSELPDGYLIHLWAWLSQPAQ